MLLTPQLQQLLYSFFFLERLTEYHAPVSLVEACLGLETPDLELWNIPQCFFLHPETLRIKQICHLYLTVSVFFCLSPGIYLCFGSSQYLMESIHNLQVVHGRKVTNWVVKFKNHHKRLRCIGQVLYNPECLVWVRSSRDNEQRLPIGKERGADWFRTRSETLVLGVCS